jgi:hypothetical protein
MATVEVPTESAVFVAARLMTEHPPVFRHPNKQAVYECACPPGCTHGGEIRYTRWSPMPLPERILPMEGVRRAARCEDLYDYARALSAAGAVEWHVNFADPLLFAAYGSGLFAQDEMQVAEHPVLGALKEALIAERRPAQTVENGGRPTPILVKGAERRCRVATDRDVARGRPFGLYGNAFAAAPAEAVRRAVTAIDPPTITNLIAMAAPSYGRGPYSVQQIDFILSTAYTGFRAAVLESGDAPVAVHTGFWGCGAFGGNRILMALLQVVAAGTAGVEQLVFHTHHAAGSVAYDSAIGRIRDDLGESAISPSDLVNQVAGMRYQWGTSDGN